MVVRMFVLDDGTLVHSASDLTAAATCEFASLRTLDRVLGHTVEAAPAPDALLARVTSLGRRHEQDALAGLLAEHGGWDVDGGGVRAIARPGRDDYDRRAALEQMDTDTAKALVDGSTVIYQAGFFDGSFVGWADFLVREQSPAGMVWSVRDTKLARSEKVLALIQLAAYADQLERSGVPVSDQVHLILGTGQSVTRRTDDLVPVYRERSRRLLRLLGDHRDAGTPVRWGDAGVTACGRCAACTSEIEAVRDPLLVAGLTVTQRARLAAAGVCTVEALAGSSGPVDGIGATTLSRLRAQAALQAAQDAGDGTVHSEVFSPQAIASLPAADPGDIFFDFEGDPLWYDDTPGTRDADRWGLEYLFGVVEAPIGDAPAVFRPFWAHDRVQEKVALAEFLTYVRERRAEYPGMHIYHYAPYEKSALLRLAARHGVGEDEVDQLLREGVLVDLYATVRASLRVGQRSYSLKKLEPLYMPQARSGEVTTAGESITEYADACDLRDQGEHQGWLDKLEQIAGYNEYDCQSTLELRNWLLERASAPPAPPAATLAGEAAATAVDPIETDGVLTALDAFTQPAGGARTSDQAAVALVAAAVNFHVREEKPFWWAHFDRLSADPSEWTDPRSTMVVDTAEVVDTWAVPLRGTRPRRTLRLTGRLSAGSDLTAGKDVYLLYDAPVPGAANRATGSPRGWTDGAKIVTATTTGPDETDILTINESIAADAPRHDTLPIAVGPAALWINGPLKSAIHAYASDLAARLPDLPADAVLDLLRRRPPRLLGSAPLPRAAADTPVHVAITDAVRELDHSYLAVQGPPGTGKSYNGARVIEALAREGWKIGVVAQSHTTVEHLLSAVLEAGAPADRVAKKPSTGDTSEHPWVKLRDTRAFKRFFDQQPSGFVVGGTCWDFAGDTKIPPGGYDLIVIDEAGQFSLANTIAIAGATDRLLLLGDPQQLPQVSQGTHPEPVDRSALDWLMDGADTLPTSLGYFLDATWRMHPGLCATVSRLSYANRLTSVAPPTRNLDGVRPGVHAEAVEHTGNAVLSAEEADTVTALVSDLLKRTWTDATGMDRQLSPADILVVAAYNAQVAKIRHTLEAHSITGIRVGTVDKFQGKEAPVVVLSMAASSPMDVPRGMEFLLNRNRLNVAISRAQWASYVVHSRALTNYLPGTPDGLAELGAFLRVIAED